MALSETYRAGLLRQETTAGVGAQLLLLVLLTAVSGLGPAGWLAGLVFTAGSWTLLARALGRSGSASFGPANGVTLARAVLVGGVTALVADSVVQPPPAAVLVPLAAVALVLDAVDGRVARRTGTVSALGARFDMEVDAFLILVLSVHVSLSLGPWVLLTGAMRYVFGLAGGALPWLHGPLPPSTARKTVAAVQGVVLVAAGSGVLPRPVAAAAVLTALSLLLWSFTRDVAWLWRAVGRGRDVRRGAAAGREGVRGGR
ncbi:CDP-alcohol phosphatidyltransferase family protein [Streptomyces sp. JJ36]|uniref:CDP-alcohol phosphatidyltransferase family protein n=1 Tax=Streptomyces sp. JJ36 TaxID=2736645 RepID=UPI001F213DD3|nr:CDP-alcohol phosphatidyltransferase family protein [Streptomyces sp. JJ36]MCF6524553.1 CDP-alcohol phosphatidyltransferase family protein [Streptomyces sp. JJ36]